MEGAAETRQRPPLGVDRSFGGRRWRWRAAGDAAALALAQRLGVSEIVGRVLAGRGVGPEEGPLYLEPRLREQLPDPSVFRDMDRAAARLAAAVRGGERIAVFGDYDVDGATSSALLKRFFAALGVAVRVYIPDRLTEGYGPNPAALRRLRDEGASVVVTVDCGTTAHAALAAAADLGLDVIVVDHHVAESGLPPALAVVNPNRLDESGAHGQLAAVGVAFLLAVAVNRELRAAGWYDGTGRPEPDLRRWLDLVALGTICDVVPLTGVNRALVSQGLKVMARRANPGLAALADVARLSEPPGAYHAGFVLGPRVNAGGRVGEADLGARLLATDDPEEARRLAHLLDEHNRERRRIEEGVLAEALAAAEAMEDAPALLVAADGWHPGVIGIVASRLKERFNRPAFVVAFDGAVGKGSGRSIGGVDMGAAIIAARQAGLLIDGGGHAMAAGFSVERGRLEALRRFLVERLGGEIAAKGIVPGLAVDGVISVPAATLDLA